MKTLFPAPFDGKNACDDWLDSFFPDGVIDYAGGGQRRYLFMMDHRAYVIDYSTTSHIMAFKALEGDLAPLYPVLDELAAVCVEDEDEFNHMIVKREVVGNTLQVGFYHWGE